MQKRTSRSRQRKYVSTLQHSLESIQLDTEPKHCHPHTRNLITEPLNLCVSVSCLTVDDWLDYQGPVPPWHWWEPRGQGQEASLGKVAQTKALRILEYCDYTICTPHLALPLILSSFSRWPIPCMIQLCPSALCPSWDRCLCLLPVEFCSFRHIWPSRWVQHPWPHSFFSTSG